MMQQIGFKLEAVGYSQAITSEYTPGEELLVVNRDTCERHHMIIETCEHNALGEPLYVQCRNFIADGAGYNQRYHLMITTRTEGKTGKLYCSGRFVIAKVPSLHDTPWGQKPLDMAEYETGLTDKRIALQVDARLAKLREQELQPKKLKRKGVK